MDTLLAQGDHVLDSRGLPATVSGTEELIQRALIRLSVKKGSFGPDPALGSELYKLGRVKGDIRDRVALSYAQEALLPLPEIAVESAACTLSQPGELVLALTLAAGSARYQLEVNITT